MSSRGGVLAIAAVSLVGVRGTLSSRRWSMAPLVLCPIRCFTCGGEVCSKNEQYRELLRSGVQSHEALATVRASRLCCKRMLLGQPNHIALTRAWLQNRQPRQPRRGSGGADEARGSRSAPMPELGNRDEESGEDNAVSDEEDARA